jgi:hypothetical protein
VKLIEFPETKAELRALVSEPYIILPGYAADPTTQRRAAKYINPPAMPFGNGCNNFRVVG